MFFSLRFQSLSRVLKTKQACCDHSDRKKTLTLIWKTDEIFHGAKQRSSILIWQSICGCSSLVPLAVPHYPEGRAVTSSMCAAAFKRVHAHTHVHAWIGDLLCQCTSNSRFLFIGWESSILRHTTRRTDYRLLSSVSPLVLLPFPTVVPLCIYFPLSFLLSLSLSLSLCFFFLLLAVVLPLLLNAEPQQPPDHFQTHLASYTLRSVLMWPLYLMLVTLVCPVGSRLICGSQTRILLSGQSQRATQQQLMKCEPIVSTQPCDL